MIIKKSVIRTFSNLGLILGYIPALVEVSITQFFRNLTVNWDYQSAPKKGCKDRTTKVVMS